MKRITAVTLEKDEKATASNDLVRALRHQLGMSEKVAVMVLAELSAWAGGQYKSSLHIPSTSVKEAKTADVRRDFNGRNRLEVMRKHGISKNTFYRIISERRDISP